MGDIVPFRWGMARTREEGGGMGEDWRQAKAGMVSIPAHGSYSFVPPARIPIRVKTEIDLGENHNLRVKPSGYRSVFRSFLAVKVRLDNLNELLEQVFVFHGDELFHFLAVFLGFDNLHNV